MKKVFPFLACILLIGICCTNQSTELTDEQKATIISEVGNQMEKIRSTINQLDIDAWSEYWSEDEFISVSSGMNYFNNRSTWVDSVAYWWSFLESRSIEPIERSVTPLTPELALATRIVEGEDITKNGEQRSFTALVTVVWKKETNGWKIINTHESWQDVIEE